MKLQRTTSSSRWIPEIDGLRSVAILAVLALHVFSQTVSRGGVVLAGATPATLLRVDQLGRGVQLFFVISGFILAQPFLRQHVDGGPAVSLRGFYLRRITRLEPPYVLALLLYAGARVVTHTTSDKLGMALLASLFYVHNFLPHLIWINFVTWSLEVEVVFYLLAPALALLFRIRPAGLRRAVLTALVIGAALAPTGAADRIAFLFPRNASFFLLGYLLADFRIHQLTGRGHRLWDLVAVLVWPLYFWVGPNAWTRLILTALLGAGICAAMLGPLARSVVAWRPLALLGGMCYSIYLMHMLFISALFPFTRRALIFHSLALNVLGQSLLLLPGVLAGCVLYFVAVERPCMDPRWPRKLWHRIAAAPMETNERSLEAEP